MGKVYTDDILDEYGPDKYLDTRFEHEFLADEYEADLTMVNDTLQLVTIVPQFTLDEEE